MGKRYLDCHTTGKMQETEEIFAIEGKSYEVIGEGESSFLINDELGTEHSFSKEPYSDDGVSYKTWFNLVETKGSETVATEEEA